MRKPEIIIGSGLVAVATLVLLLLILVNRSVASRTGPEHHFPVQGERNLSEERAVEVACQVMIRDGKALTDWKLYNTDGQEALDGEEHGVLNRNTINPNQGSIRFLSVTGPLREQNINLELRDGVIVGQRSLGK